LRCTLEWVPRLCADHQEVQPRLLYDQLIRGDRLFACHGRLADH